MITFRPFSQRWHQKPRRKPLILPKPKQNNIYILSIHFLSKALKNPLSIQKPQEINKITIDERCRFLALNSRCWPQMQMMTNIFIFCLEICFFNEKTWSYIIAEAINNQLKCKPIIRNVQRGNIFKNIFKWLENKTNVEQERQKNWRKKWKLMKTRKVLALPNKEEYVEKSNYFT